MLQISGVRPNGSTDRPLLQGSNLRKDARVVKSVAFWLLVLVLFGTVLTHSPGMTDFRSYYAAGGLIRHEPQNLYSADAQFRGQSQIGSGPFFPWAHLPPEALIVAPLTFVSFRHAVAIWNGTSLLLILLAAWQLKPDWRGYSAFTAVLCPITIGLHAGQDVFIILAALSAGFVYLRRGRDFVAGCLIGIGLLRFTIMIPFLCFWAAARRWKILSGAACTGICLAAISFAAVGRQVIPEYLKMCRLLAASHDSADAVRMPTLRGFFTVVLGYHPYNYIAVIAVSAIILGWGLRQCARWKDSPHRTETLFAFALTISIVLDYQGYIYNVALLLVPVVLLQARWPDTSKFLFFFAFATFCIGLFVGGAFGLVAPFILATSVLIQRSGSSDRVATRAI